MDVIQTRSGLEPRGMRQMSNGTTTWTVRYTVSSGHHVHYKVFRDHAAAENFARWWEGRGDGFESFVLPR
jgi:hypothetical protein